MSDTSTWVKAYLNALLAQADVASVRALAPLSLSSEHGRAQAITLRQLIDQTARVLLTGPAGSGKSSAAKQLAYQLADAKSKEQRSRTKQQIPIPLLIDLTHYAGSLEKTLAEVYACGTPPPWRDMADQSVMFIVDGLERLATDVQLSALSHIAATMSVAGPTARWVLTCRSEALPLFRPWFSGVEVRALRPLTPRDVISQVRAHCGEAWATQVEADDAVLSLASRPRWLAALTETLRGTASTHAGLRGQLLHDWMVQVAALVGAESSLLLGDLVRLHGLLSTLPEPWMLNDVLVRWLPSEQRNTVIAQQLAGAPATSDGVLSLQTAVTMGVLRFECDQQTISYAHPLIRSLIVGHVWIEQPLANWSMGQITADEDALSVAIDMAPHRVDVLRRLFELGMVRQSVKALLQTVDAAQVGAILAKSGVKQGTMLMTVADVLQQEGAPQLARQQLESLGGAAQNDVQVMRRIAELSCDMQDWPAAVQAYELVCRLAPDDLRSREQLGVVYSKMGSLDDAARSLTQLLTVYRRQAAQVAKELGQVHVRQQQYATALDVFDQALQDLPDDIELYQGKGDALEQLHRYGEADQVLAQAIARFGEQAPLLAAKGRIGLMLGQTEHAQELLSKAIRLAPDDASCHAALGQVHARNGDRVAAQSALQRAVQLQPDQHQWYAQLAQVAEQLDDVDAAIVALRRAVALAPQIAEYPRVLAGLLERRGDSDEAVQVIRTALTHASDTEHLHTALAGLLWQRGDHEAALTQYRKAMALAPKQSRHMHVMAKSLSDLGRYREAIDVYNQALGIDGDSAPLVVDALHAYEAQGLYGQAETILNRALLHNDDTSLLQAAAGFALRRGHVAKARGYLAKALRQNRHNDETWYQVALVHISESVWSLALFALQRIRDQYAPHILAATAQARAGLGMIDSAIAAFEDALRVNPGMTSTRVAYSKALAQFGRFESAYVQAVQAHQDAPTDVETLVQVAQMALETLRPNEALEYNDDALQRAPRRIDVLCQRSHILLAKNQPDEALAVAQRALEIDRQALPVLVALAQANHALQHLAEAQGFYQQILLIDAHHEAALIGMRDIALQQGEITAAADAAQRLVSLHPKSAHHHLRLGEVLVALGVPEAALIELQQAIDLDRMAPQAKGSGGGQLASHAYARMSAAYAKSARWSEARECAEEAVKRTPDVAEHHALLGDALLGLGQRVAAAASYRQAVHYQPLNAQWQYLLGYLLHQIGSDKEAIPALQQAVALTDRADYYHLLGVAHLAAGESKQAVKAFSKALQKRPDAHHWRADLADVHAARGWYNEAIAEIDQALVDASDHPVLWRKRAELLLRSGQPDVAMGDIVEALRRDAHDVKALTLMSQIMHQKGQPERALEAAERAVAADPSDAQARYQLASLLRALKRHGDAIPHLSAALRLRDQEYTWWMELADAYDCIHDPHKAADYMRRAVELQPRDLHLAYRYGELLFKAGAYEAAEAELRRIMVVEPTNAPAIACLADVMVAQGRVDEAHSLARRAVDLEGDQSDHWRVLAVVLRAEKRFDEALEVARTAHELDPQNAAAALMYGVLLLDFEQVPEAVRAFSEAVRADDSRAIYHLCLGLALRQQVPLPLDIEDFGTTTPEQTVALTAALQSFDRALMIVSDDPRCIFERGIVLQMLGRHYEAVATFDAAAALQGDVHPRSISGDAAEASALDKNDLSAHIRQRRALSLLCVKRYTDAQADVRYVLAIVPLSAQDLYIAGRVALLLDQVAEARSLLASAAVQQPGNAKVQQWYGATLLQLGQIVESTRVLELANDLAPGSGRINALLRDAYIADNRSDRALSAAQRAVRFDPSNPDYHVALAKLYADGRRDRDARSALIHAITLKNDVLEWHMLLGDICLRMGLYDNARSAYLSAETIDPSATAPHFAIAQLLVIQGRLQDAVSSLKQTLMKNPENPEWHHRLGTLYEQLGNPTEAAESFRRAMEYGGDKPKYYSAYAKYAPAAGSSPSSEGTASPSGAGELPIDAQIIKQAGKFQSEAEIFLALGDVMVEQGSLSSALEQYEKALRIEYANAEALWRFGRAKALLGLDSDAKAAFEDALKYDKRSVPALAGLASLARKRGEFVEALRMIELVIEIAPAEYEYYIERAELLWECGQKADSKQVVIHIEYMVPRQPPMLYRYALIAMKHNLYDTAIDMLERAIRAKPTAIYYVALGDAQRANSNYAHALQAYRQALVLDPTLKDIHGLISNMSPLSINRPRPGSDSRNKRNDTK